ncbi:hypothetical protein SAMN04487819_111114 [Actinopolyspora alba]|uniref:Right handed beta helix region n=1 Tax=Actinopolyspora alba TaxID=673379 RepID=A0A1I1ZRC3_9ACTN|nr:hypothetical protein [Actinopolyspora alba]SFE34324.1 hypothetical protein SAMN04487819_111114 [Actinopolyspora alba]
MSPDGTNGTDRNTEGGLGRRNFLKLGTAGAAGLALAGTTASTAMASSRTTAAPTSVNTAAAVTTMPDPAPVDLKQGGGVTYHASPGDTPEFHVNDFNGLKNALESAGDGDIIRVADDAAIDMTGAENTLSIGTGVIISGGRGNNGSLGGLIYTTRNRNPVADKALPMFKTYGDRVRFTGIRLQGPRLANYWDPEGYDGNPYDDTAYDNYLIGGIHFLGDDCRVDNCQLYGFTHAAISVGAGGYQVSSRIDHNSIHNNPMEHFGYGVNLYNGHSVIEWNYFDYNRHSIAGYGYASNGYTARYNLVGEHPISHAFDMHGRAQNDGSDTEVAGGTINIHHNTFRFTTDVFPDSRAQEAIAIRGVPANRCDIDNNWFYHDSKPVAVNEQGNAYRQENDQWMHMWASGNHFGRSEPAADIGHPR